MTKSSYLSIAIVAFVIVIGLSSCEEIGPDICLKNCGPQDVLVDTTYITSNVQQPQPKKVLLEDFTGVRCTNCPQGHGLAHDLEVQHLGQIVAVGCHSDFLAQPYPGWPDLRTTAANNLSDLLSPPAKPYAAIDRVRWPGQTFIPVGLQNWSGNTNTRLQEVPPVNLNLTSTYTDTSRETIIRMELHYTQTLAGSNRFGLWLMEDSINSAQLNGSNVDSPYFHMHVLREYLTPVNGVAINESLVPGRVIIKEFPVTISSAYDADQVTIGLWVSAGGASLEILQAAKTKLK